MYKKKISFGKKGRYMNFQEIKILKINNCTINLYLFIWFFVINGIIKKYLLRILLQMLSNISQKIITMIKK